MQILGLEKNRVMQNSRKWDWSKYSTNAKILHLRVHKLKIPWGTPCTAKLLLKKKDDVGLGC